jgi:hypothetical protein
MKNKAALILILTCCCCMALAASATPASHLNSTGDRDTVKKDIPMEPTRHHGPMVPVGYYKYKINIEKKMGFATLENGFDSLYIRLWYGYSNSVDTLQLVTIQYSGGKWKARLYLLPIKVDRHTDTTIAVKQIVGDVVPRAGWQSFSSRLLAHHIMTLPDMRNIPKYPDLTGGGSSVTIEVATQRMYRIYSYTDPRLATGHPQARDIEAILKLIREQLGLKQLRSI